MDNHHLGKVNYQEHDMRVEDFILSKPQIYPDEEVVEFLSYVRAARHKILSLPLKRI